MSAIADNRLRLLYKLREYLIRVRWTSNGIDLRQMCGGKRDVKTLAEAFTLFCCLLVDLGINITDAIRVVKQLSNTDTTKVFQLFKALDDTLLAFLGGKDPTVPDTVTLVRRFKHVIGEDDCLNFVIDFLSNDLGSEKGVYAFRNLHQCFAFLSRVSLVTVDGKKDVDDFLHRNQSLREVNVEIALELDRIISEILCGVEFEPWGHHGSGSTSDAGRVDPIEKTLFIRPDRLHEYVYSHYLKEDIRDYIPFDNVTPCIGERVACVTTVPKTALKRRIIAVESVTQQWFQQLVMRALYHHIDAKVPNVPIRDQKVQRRRAYEGSISGKYATIDLSAASDSISWDLVKIAFRHSGILPYLYMTRSRYVQCGKERYPLRIFATMGSACCFPVMCILLYAVCKLVTNNAGRKRCDCTVYGDDIICPVELVGDIHRILVELGFTMNTTKSYYDDVPLTFRESCGAEYYAGYDVTPIRIPRRFSGESVSNSPELLTELVDFANACYSRYYYTARQYVVRRLLDQCTPPPIFGDLDGQIHTDDKATNFGCLRRWNSDYQRLEWLGTTARASRYSCKYITSTDYTLDSRLRVYRDFDYLYARDDHANSLIDHLSYFLWWATRRNDDNNILSPSSSSVAAGPIQLSTEWVHTY